MYNVPTLFGNLQHRSLTCRSPGGHDRKSLTNFYNITLYRVHLALTGFELTTLVVIGNDLHIGSCKSNYHTITNHEDPCMFNTFIVHL